MLAFSAQQFSILCNINPFFHTFGNSEHEGIVVAQLLSDVSRFISPAAADSGPFNRFLLVSQRSRFSLCCSPPASSCKIQLFSGIPDRAPTFSHLSPSIFLHTHCPYLFFPPFLLLITLPLSRSTSLLSHTSLPLSSTLNFPPCIGSQMSLLAAVDRVSGLQWLLTLPE